MKRPNMQGLVPSKPFYLTFNKPPWSCLTWVGSSLTWKCRTRLPLTGDEPSSLNYFFISDKVKKIHNLGFRFFFKKNHFKSVVQRDGFSVTPPVSTIEIFGLTDVDGVTAVTLNDLPIKFSKEPSIQVINCSGLFSLLLPTAAGGETRTLDPGLRRRVDYHWVTPSG